MSKILSARSLRLFLSILFLFAVFFFDHHLASAANLISGRYLSASGNAVVLSLTIQKPSPTNLIVEQYLAPGNSIAGTSPRAIRVDLDHRKVKWLFRNIDSGKLNLTIHLKSPLKGNVSAMVRYRDPDSGTFTEMRIIP